MICRSVLSPFICSRARIAQIACPGIDSKESIPRAYVSWRVGTSNRVVVLTRQTGNRFLGSFKGLQIRVLVGGTFAKNQNHFHLPWQNWPWEVVLEQRGLRRLRLCKYSGNWDRSRWRVVNPYRFSVSREARYIYPIRIEESGEQITVVFALIVTEPASEWMWGGDCYVYPIPPLARSVTIYAKTTVDFSPDSFIKVTIVIRMTLRVISWRMLRWGSKIVDIRASPELVQHFVSRGSPHRRKGVADKQLTVLKLGKIQ